MVEWREGVWIVLFSEVPILRHCLNIFGRRLKVNPYLTLQKNCVYLKYTILQSLVSFMQLRKTTVDYSERQVKQTNGYTAHRIHN